MSVFFIYGDEMNLPLESVSLSFQPPLCLLSAHMQTIVPALLGKAQVQVSNRPSLERWATPDGDFVDVYQREAVDKSSPLVVLFHGLEGSYQSHYVRLFESAAEELGFSFAMPHFRGCSGPINHAARAYHSGDWQEIDWMLKRFAEERPVREIYAVGVSLGGNALMLWAGHKKHQAMQSVAAVAAISAPLDLSAAGEELGRGFNRWVYGRMFLRTMKAKARAKWHQFPDLFDLKRANSAKTLREFDDAFTAPVHGFKGVDDYWCRASAKPWLRDVQVPSLLLNAVNDPFVPAASLPSVSDVSTSITLWHPAQGGHVGFPVRSGNRLSWHGLAMPRAVLAWMVRAGNNQMVF